MVELLDKKVKDQLIKKLGLSGLEFLEKEKIYNGLIKNILARIDLVILEKLSEKDKKKLSKISNSIFVLNKGKKIAEFLNLKNINFKDLVEKLTLQAIDEFKVK